MWWTIVFCVFEDVEEDGACATTEEGDAAEDPAPEGTMTALRRGRIRGEDTGDTPEDGEEEEDDEEEEEEEDEIPIASLEDFLWTCQRALRLCEEDARERVFL